MSKHTCRNVISAKGLQPLEERGEQKWAGCSNCWNALSCNESITQTSLPRNPWAGQKPHCKKTWGDWEVIVPREAAQTAFCPFHNLSYTWRISNAQGTKGMKGAICIIHKTCKLFLLISLLKSVGVCCVCQEGQSRPSWREVRMGSKPKKRL